MGRQKTAEEKHKTRMEKHRKSPTKFLKKKSLKKESPIQVTGKGVRRQVAPVRLAVGQRRKAAQIARYGTDKGDTPTPGQRAILRVGPGVGDDVTVNTETTPGSFNDVGAFDDEDSMEDSKRSSTPRKVDGSMHFGPTAFPQVTDANMTSDTGTPRSGTTHGSSFGSSIGSGGKSKKRRSSVKRCKTKKCKGCKKCKSPRSRRGARARR